MHDNTTIKQNTGTAKESSMVAHPIQPCAEVPAIVQVFRKKSKKQNTFRSSLTIWVAKLCPPTESHISKVFQGWNLPSANRTDHSHSAIHLGLSGTCSASRRGQRNSNLKLTKFSIRSIQVASFPRRLHAKLYWSPQKKTDSTRSTGASCGHRQQTPTSKVPRKLTRHAQFSTIKPYSLGTWHPHRSADPTRSAQQKCQRQYCPLE